MPFIITLIIIVAMFSMQLHEFINGDELQYEVGLSVGVWC